MRNSAICTVCGMLIHEAAESLTKNPIHDMPTYDDDGAYDLPPGSRDGEEKNQYDFTEDSDPKAKKQEEAQYVQKIERQKHLLQVWRHMSW